MRVLVVGEGPHDEAALIPLVRRLNPAVSVTEFDRVKNRNRRLHRGKGGGVFKLAVVWLMEAAQRGRDALVLVLDEDGDAGKRSQLSEAQKLSKGVTRRALGVATDALEAWMLADEKALSAAAAVNVTRQPNPEAIRNPKDHITTVLMEAGFGTPHRELYASVAETADLDTLAQRCPDGFAPFAARVRNLDS